jgi:hypothetical protein
VRLKGRQLQFLLVTTTGWVALRVGANWPDAAADPPAGAASSGRPAAYAAVARRAVAQRPRRLPDAAPVPARARPGRRIAATPIAGPALADAPAPAANPPPAAVLAAAILPAIPAAPGAGGGAGPAHDPPAAASRWAASATLFVRPGGTRPSLAGGGALGGSQAAARIAYRLNDGASVRTALVARAYAPLQGKGAEAAAGIDWHPLPGRPLRLTIERRVGLDAWGRDAWSAYAAGGVYAEPRPGLVVDGYAQAGLVGLRSRDLFADGAVRAGARIARDGVALVAGAGLWAAAQPQVERIDAGPRLALTIERHQLGLAVEGRFRLAGDARPGSGAALTLSVDF